jgi:integrase
METGLRPVELCNLRVKDIDLEQRLVYPTTAKHGNARVLKISQSLQKLLQEHIIRNNLNPTDRMFKGDATIYGNVFRHKRNQLAKKLQDPTIKQVRLYDFRHYFATMTYHKTRDLLFTKQQMGHTKVETTLIYTQLLNLNDDEWTCKTAKNVNEATQLVEAGFEYVTEMDGLKLFRKRK